jgi:DNA ligase-1
MKVYNENQDLYGWLLSEKYDGINATWDGDGCLWSRNNKPINAPQWFLDQFPKDQVLHGELWVGRGKFQEVVSICRKKQPIDDEWKRVKFMLFESHGKAPIRNNSICPIQYYRCSDRDSMENFYNDIISQGGEGIVLTAIKGVNYKKKPVLADEATVLGWVDGKGKFADGLAGALEVSWKGFTFKLSLPLKELRQSPPKPGSVVTFEYRGLTDAGKPRFPTFLVERDYE